MLLRLRRLLNRTIVPRSLFWRSLMIVVLPLLTLQVLLTFMFYNRHWDAVTRWLAYGAAGEVALVAQHLDELPDPAEQAAFLARVGRESNLRLQLRRGVTLAEATAAVRIDAAGGHIDAKIIEGFSERLAQPMLIDLATDDAERIAVYVQVVPGVLVVEVPRRRVTSTTAWLLFGWMVGGSAVLIGIAIYFMRLQVRPIRQLARAAEGFGKGRDVGDFRPRGALEIRQAAHAFNLMRHRILRHISQRTELLAAVSHDLRTPLTRMRLELELLEADRDPVLAGLRQDVNEMSRLVDEYLGFARGEGREVAEPTDLGPVLESMRQRAERKGVALEIALARPIVLPLRPTAFHRCLGNLVDNACRYGHWVGISAREGEETVEIAIEDDGPGIPEPFRDKVFEPFFRLDGQQAQADTGSGLGLTIARDVALAHGGDLKLDRSGRGGLKAVLRLPA